MLHFACYSDCLQEIHASHVESTLLSQVRVASVGQEIDVWVLGRTRVRLTVGMAVDSTRRSYGLTRLSVFGSTKQGRPLAYDQYRSQHRAEAP